MMLFGKGFVAAAIIIVSGMVARDNPRLGGFILALPITTMIALAFNFTEYRDSETTVNFAKNAFYAIPVSLLFFVPFLFSGRLKVSFWTLYLMGVILLAAGYLIHKVLINTFAKL